jgi:hypothetical protein
METKQLVQILKGMGGFFNDAIKVVSPMLPTPTGPVADYFNAHPNDKSEFGAFSQKLMALLGTELFSFANKAKALIEGDEAAVKDFEQFLNRATQVKKFLEKGVAFLKDIFNRFKAFVSGEKATDELEQAEVLDETAPLTFSNRTDSGQAITLSDEASSELNVDIDDFMSIFQSNIGSLNDTLGTNWVVTKDVTRPIFTCKSGDKSCTVNLTRGFHANSKNSDSESLDVLLNSAKAYQQAKRNAATADSPYVPTSLTLSCDNEDVAKEIFKKLENEELNITKIKIKNPSMPGEYMFLTPERVAELKVREPQAQAVVQESDLRTSKRLA